MYDGFEFGSMILCESVPGTWTLVLLGSVRDHRVQSMMSLKSSDEEGAIEEVFETFDIGWDERKTILPVLEIWRAE